MIYQGCPQLRLVHGFGFPNKEILHYYCLYGGNGLAVVHYQEWHAALHLYKLYTEVRLR